MSGISSAFSSYVPKQRSFNAVRAVEDDTLCINQPLANSEASINRPLVNPNQVIGQPLSDPNAVISGTLMTHVARGIYTGDYSVVPTVDGLTLATADKTMIDDLVIEKIPFWETSNLSGGKTVYIADDVTIS